METTQAEISDGCIIVPPKGVDSIHLGRGYSLCLCEVNKAMAEQQERDEIRRKGIEGAGSWLKWALQGGKLPPVKHPMPLALAVKVEYSKCPNCGNR